MLCHNRSLSRDRCSPVLCCPSTETAPPNTSSHVPSNAFLSFPFQDATLVLHVTKKHTCGKRRSVFHSRPSSRPAHSGNRTADDEPHGTAYQTEGIRDVSPINEGVPQEHPSTSTCLYFAVIDFVGWTRTSRTTRRASHPTPQRTHHKQQTSG